jgi:hypothetical protein
MLHSRRNAVAKAAQIVMWRSSRFLLAGLAAMLCGLWSLLAAAQGGHLPPDIAGFLLNDPSVCWSFQGSRHTGQQLAEELDRYAEHELARGRPVPAWIDRSGRQPILAVHVLAHIDYAKPAPCPLKTAAAPPSPIHAPGKPAAASARLHREILPPERTFLDGSVSIGIAAGVTTGHRDGSLNFLDVISDETAATGQSGSSTFGTFGVLGTFVLPGVVPITVLPGSQGFFETGILFHTDNHQAASFTNFSGNEATGQTTTKENWSVPLLVGIQTPVTNFGIQVPNVLFQIKGGGMIDNRQASFSAFEVLPDLTTSVSVTKTQFNPAFGLGLLYTPGGPFTFGVQTIFDFQQPINFTVQSMPFPSAFYTVHTGNQLNTTVVVTASAPITFATHFGLGF